ncbi:MAG TPA: hypothetical protein VGR47_23240 [Terracidiphilus sp.]|nr:hypothetical protein [Terracidiphilus sp.]
MLVVWSESENLFGDALECSRASRYQTAISLRSINAAISGVNRTQGKITETLARISATDRLIVMLGREIISSRNAADAEPSVESL